MLLGKIVSLGKQNYAKVVTQFGQIKGLVAPNNLKPCTTTNTKFDYFFFIFPTMAMSIIYFHI